MPDTHINVQPPPADPALFTETLLQRLERIARMEALSEAQEKRLDDHDQVLVDIRAHLKELVERVDKFQNRLLIVAAVMLGGSHNAADVVKALLNQVG